MIKVKTFNSNLQIISIEISGHAKSDEYGKDLVCAAVSTVITGSCNALDQLVPDSCVIDLKAGLTKIKIIDNSEKVQTILNTMLVQLKTVEQKYPDYIALSTIDMEE